MTTGVRIGPSRKTLQRMDSAGCSFASDQNDCEAMGWSVVKMFIRAIKDKWTGGLCGRPGQLAVGLS
jgi:hypothetical protein